MKNTLKRIQVKLNIFLKVNMPLMLLIIIMKLKVLQLLFYYFILLKLYLNSKWNYIYFFSMIKYIY
jgi:hypothetical protein